MFLVLHSGGAWRRKRTDMNWGSLPCVTWRKVSCWYWVVVSAPSRGVSNAEHACNSLNTHGASDANDN